MDYHGRMTRRRTIILGLIVLLALGLRVAGLSEQGIFMHDEGSYLLQARNLSEHVTWLVGNLPRVARGETPAPFTWTPRVRDLSRPFHLVLLSLAGCDAAASLWLMAIMGAGVTLLTALIARRIADEEASTLPEWAALFVALSPSQVFHSRILLAEIDAVFFLLLAVYLYLGPPDRWRLPAAGAGAALAYLTQLRFITLLPFFLLWEIAVWRSWARLRGLLAGFLLPILLLELAWRASGFIFHLLGTPCFIQPPLGLLSFQVNEQYAGGLGWNRPWFGLRYLQMTEGALAIFLAIAGGWLAARKNPTSRRFFFMSAGFTVWVILVASLYQLAYSPITRFGRSMAAAVPFFAILAAVPLAELWRAPRGRIAAGLLALAVLLPRISPLEELVAMRSDYAPIFRAAARRSGTPVISDYAPQGMVALPGDWDVLWPAGPLPPATVLVFERAVYRHCFPLLRDLPDTPAYTIPRSMRASGLMALEGVSDPWFTPVAPCYPPAEVFLLGRPDSAAVRAPSRE